MSQYADLEITLRERGKGVYAASFRYNGSGDAAEQSFPSDEALILDPETLAMQRGAEYAKALTAAFSPLP